MKYCISKLLRDVVAIQMSLDSVYKILPEGLIKSTLNRVLHQSISESGVHEIYNDLKTRFKSLSSDTRMLFKTLILDLLQVQLGMVERVNLDVAKWIESYEELKKINQEDWSALNKAIKMQQEGLTKGVRPSQIKPTTQRMPAASLINP